MPLDELKKVIEPMHSLMSFSFSEIESQMKIWEQIWIEKKARANRFLKMQLTHCH